MALQVVTSFGTIDPNQLFTGAFLTELFQDSAQTVIGSVSGSTILTAASILNTHLADDAVDARVWKDTEAGFTCAGLTINGPLALAGGTGTLTAAGTATLNGAVVLGSGSNNVSCGGVPDPNWIRSRSAVGGFTLADEIWLARESAGTWTIRKGTLQQLRSAMLADTILVEDRVGQISGTSGWVNHNLTTLTTYTTGVSLATNVLTLPAGHYRVWAYGSWSGFQYSMLRLRTVAGTTLVDGITAVCPTGGTNGFGTVQLAGQFTLATSDQVRVQQFVSADVVSGSLGTIVGGAIPGVTERCLLVWLEYTELL